MFDINILYYTNSECGTRVGDIVIEKIFYYLFLRLNTLCFNPLKCSQQQQYKIIIKTFSISLDILWKYNIIMMTIVLYYVQTCCTVFAETSRCFYTCKMILINTPIPLQRHTGTSNNTCAIKYSYCKHKIWFKRYNNITIVVPISHSRSAIPYVILNKRNVFKCI